MNAHLIVEALLDDEVEDFLDRQNTGYAVCYKSGGGLIYYWTGRHPSLDGNVMDYSGWNEDIHKAKLFPTEQEAATWAKNWEERDATYVGTYTTVVRMTESDDVNDFFDRNMPELEYPSPEQAKYDLRVEEETEDPARNFQDDPDAVQWILAEIRRGNLYAWFSACCEAKWTDAEGREYIGRDYLGCCSYKSRADFMTEDGYWPQMKSEAYDELIKAIRKRREEDFKFKMSDNAVLKKHAERARRRRG